MATFRRKKRNAFVFFLYEQQDLDRRTRSEAGAGAGGPPVDNASFSAAVGSRWQALTPAQREKYERMADEWNANLVPGGRRQVGNPAPASRSEPPSSSGAVGAGDDALVGEMVAELSRKDSLFSATFHVIDFNVSCRTFQGAYLPAEVAAVRFSLGSGITACAHAFVDSHGKLPLGYMRGALSDAEETHAIPPETFPLARDDVAAVAGDVLDFCRCVEEDGRGGRMGRGPAVVFCMGDEVGKVRGCFKALCGDEMGEDDRLGVKVLSLQRLLYNLDRAAKEGSGETGAAQDVVLPSVNMAEVVLEADPHEYTAAAIACRFHDCLGDSARHCALSKAARLAYSVLGRVCLSLDDDEGSHAPLVGKAGGGGDPRPAAWMSRRLELSPSGDDALLNKALSKAILREDTTPFGAAKAKRRHAKNGHTQIPLDGDPKLAMEERRGRAEVEDDTRSLVSSSSSAVATMGFSLSSLNLTTASSASAGGGAAGDWRTTSSDARSECSSSTATAATAGERGAPSAGLATCDTTLDTTF